MAESLSEFNLIERFFVRAGRRDALVRLGIGDDCALLRSDAGSELAVTTDTLVEGIHFLPDVDPESLGFKALAVNLSDLAAMGAEPVCALLALTLPNVDERWLEAFAGGFFDLAERHSVDLVGGDTTRGPLTVTVQAFGRVRCGDALLRRTARVGDRIYVTGCLGDAGLGLKIECGEVQYHDSAPLERLHRPQPRVDVGLKLRGLATACIDISDGLAGDLGHLLDASAVGATIEWERLPLSAAVRRYIGDSGDWRLPLRGGDDYELCFTLPLSAVAELERGMSVLKCPCTCVGVIEGQKGLRILKDGTPVELDVTGYEHFS